MSLQIKRYQVDAFADKIFEGNSAVVCPLEEWLPDHVMQSIAMENNLAETAFYVNEPEGLRIRWFTTTTEVLLCGHATLATAFVLFFHEGHRGDAIKFNSLSGPLSVTKSDMLLTLNFPVDKFNEVHAMPELEKALGAKALQTFKGKTDYMLVFDREEIIQNMMPDLTQVAKVKARGIIVTAKGNQVDFVSRFFDPQSGGGEDPVTGSAHTTLTPYWSTVFGKTELNAKQLSKRGGKLHCKLLGDRVAIAGTAKLFSTGTIYLN
ncbi:MAG: PhzF family phenazine biosynthesis protein [Chryseolinea sp.]